MKRYRDPSPPASTNARKPRLLVVDDDRGNMTALYDTLNDAGYDVCAFSSATQALHSLRANRFDLILTDLRMPEIDGINLLKLAQEVDANVVGIVMTGHAAIDSAIDAMKAGAIDYILKPMKLATLRSVIERALEVRRLRVEVSELQQQVKGTIADLEAANDELESFSYSVSHDLRAPLRAINGFSMLLLDTYGKEIPEGAQQYLQKIVRNVDHMAELIEHLLHFSSLGRQSISRAPVNMAGLARETVESLQRDFPSNVSVEIGALPDAVGDAVLLRQVFVNLLANAFKFTRYREHGEIEVGCDREGNEPVYYVRDNGAGFDMQHAGQLFRVFHRLHSASEFEGTGVGLSLVQRIVQRHEGRIWADAAPDAGATFYFTVPLKPQEPGAPPTPQREPFAARPHT